MYLKIYFLENDYRKVRERNNTRETIHRFVIIKKKKIEGEREQTVKNGPTRRKC